MRRALGYVLVFMGFGLMAFGVWAIRARFERGNLNRYLPPGPRLLRILVPIGMFFLGIFVAYLSGPDSGK